MRLVRRSDCEEAVLKDINLFEGIKKSTPQKAAGGISFGLVLLIVCAVALGAVWGFQKYSETTLDSQIASLNQNIAMLQASGAGQGGTVTKQGQLSAITVYNTVIDGFRNELDAYPKLNLALLNDISKRMPSDLTVETVNVQNGIVTLAGSASGADSPANFAAALKTSAYFDLVLFIGSNYQAPASGTAAAYQYSVNCHLKGGAAQ